MQMQKYEQTTRNSNSYFLKIGSGRGGRDKKVGDVDEEMEEQEAEEGRKGKNGPVPQRLANHSWIGACPNLSQGIVCPWF